ncbi:hypothetical protein ACFL4A_04780, partial [bacterium]
MAKKEYRVDGDKFIIKDYNNTKGFASFFPAIADIWGKPMWIFYVNRGQGISCFGTKDKDGAIVEFVAANKAYRQTHLQGFRTFLKINEKVYEPFKNNVDDKGIEQQMEISSYDLTLKEVNKNLGLEVEVDYFTVPNEEIPALARVLKITNTTKTVKNIECIDGLPIILPYGTNNFMLKNISRLAEGWYNGVFFSKSTKTPVYKLPVEPLDRPEVIPVKQANFYTGFYVKNNKQINPEYIIDPDTLFGEVRDFSYPSIFVNSKNYKIDHSMTGKNKTPSAMGNFKISIKPGETFKYFSLVGNVHKVSDVDKYVKKMSNKKYFEAKKDENKIVINKIGSDVLTKSSSDKFDNYTKQNFIDNLLRGGYPLTIGKNNNYYAFSRIHGDMEREYNDFVVLPEYFSQGNGNYRDVNQNRRSDVFFNPNLKDEVIVTFMNLLQVDGFNPLKVMGVKFNVINRKDFMSQFNAESKIQIESFIKEPFSLGSFFDFLYTENIKYKDSKQMLLENLLVYSEKIDLANPGECYWSDHWHYNIDLIEAYLAIYPDKLKELLFDKKNFTYYDNSHVVLPRDDKYVLFQGEPRQLDAVYIDAKKNSMINMRKTNPNIVRTKYGGGNIYTTNLIEKLINLTANKYASLDPNGVGIEMESDRPNWCDALNGVPGTFGSSTAESFELKRLLMFLIDSLCKFKDMKILLNEETCDLLFELESITKKFAKNDYAFWDKTHTSKELFRAKTMMGISGDTKDVEVATVIKVLKLFLVKLNKGLVKSLDKKTGVVITNYQYEPTKYSHIKENGVRKVNRNGYPCIRVSEFERKPLPLFLEGPVHYLRINKNDEKAQKFHKAIMKSPLHDKKLNMLKINAPLKNVPLSTGRITIFTAGWLENESIWLHMEYKYLLEMLRNNLVDEFYSIGEKALVPFMDPNIYGRSIFENSSFIVSSGHPEKQIHGQGFVARLSGSTAEFISMWISITSGLTPFYMK